MNASCRKRAYSVCCRGQDRPARTFGDSGGKLLRAWHHPVPPRLFRLVEVAIRTINDRIEGISTTVKGNARSDGGPKPCQDLSEYQVFHALPDTFRIGRCRFLVLAMHDGKQLLKSRGPSAHYSPSLRQFAGIGKRIKVRLRPLMLYTT